MLARGARVALIATALAGAALVVPPGGPTSSGGTIALDTSRVSAEDCPPVSSTGSPLLSGGCQASVRSSRQGADSRIAFAVLSSFGPISFARCTFATNLLIGPSGEVWLDNLTVLDLVSGPCPDIVPCLSGDGKKPWRGSLEPAGPGRFGLRVHACLESCVGRFEGRVELQMRREAGDWRLAADKAPVGDSGLRIDGNWDLDDGLAIHDRKVLPPGAERPRFELRR
jgi:hypothetical protein